MAPSRRRMDGFSDDGLSYSVAGDFEKQMAQAMAEQEARTREKPQSGVTISDQIASKSDSRRYSPFGPSPDAPELLQRDLIDPVLAGFGFNTGGARNFSQAGRGKSPREPRFVKSGADIFTENDSGGLDLIHRGDRPAAKMSDRQKSDLKLIEDDLLENQKRFNQLDDSPENLDEKLRLRDRINSLDRKRRGLFEPAGAIQASPAVAAPPNLIAPSGFIGAAGGENKFFDSARTPQGTTINTAPQPDIVSAAPPTAAAQPQPARGNLLPWELRSAYLLRARGDKVLAEQLAQKDGWRTQY